MTKVVDLEKLSSLINEVIQPLLLSHLTYAEMRFVLYAAIDFLIVERCAPQSNAEAAAQYTTGDKSKPADITPDNPKQWTDTQAMHANDCEGY